MDILHFLTVSLVILLINIERCDSNGSGAPKSQCGSMVPGHEIPAQNSLVPYDVVVSKKQEQFSKLGFLKRCKSLDSKNIFMTYCSHWWMLCQKTFFFQCEKVFPNFSLSGVVKCPNLHSLGRKVKKLNFFEYKNCNYLHFWGVKCIKISS